MEITYDLIIKYLVNKQDIKNIFTTQKNVYNYTFNNKFKLLLNDKFFRLGVTTHNNNNNISFWTSILYLLDEINYTNQVNNNENDIIDTFKEYLVNRYKKSLLDTIIKKTDKISIKDKLVHEPDNICLQYITDILDITLLIFDFKNDEINILYHNTVLNPLKPIYLLSKYDHFWEPIMFLETNNNIKKVFNYNDNIIKNILNNNLIKYYEFEDNPKEYQLIKNINEIIINEKVLNNNDNNIIINIKYEKDELKKKKNTELHDICEKLNISITKKELKNELINKILKINNNDVNEELVLNTEDLHKKKNIELQNICEKLNIPFCKKDTKKDLINKISCITNNISE